MTFSAVLADEFGGKVRMYDNIEDAAIDSLEYIEFIQRLEREFRVTLKDEDVAKAKTFHDLEVLAVRSC